MVKPDSHATLFEWVTIFARTEALGTRTDRHWNGRHGERWAYRWIGDLPLRAEADDFTITWFELSITHEKTGAVLFHSTWATNHCVTAETVPARARAGRTRWKIENESNNTLKQHGYHLEHNPSINSGQVFGHGHQGLAQVLLSLNLLAFLLHTVLECGSPLYRQLRAAVGPRQTFFQAWRTLTQYVVFVSWDALFRLMCETHHVAFSLSPPGSD